MHAAASNVFATPAFGDAALRALTWHTWCKGSLRCPELVCTHGMWFAMPPGGLTLSSYSHCAPPGVRMALLFSLEWLPQFASVGEKLHLFYFLLPHSGVP